jgi:dTDP-4-dehydrorhamnose 3,5-epimerase
MNVIETEIPGVKIVEPKVFRDNRGFFLESYSGRRYESLGIPANFVQDNISFSTRGILRGLHFQNPGTQGKLAFVLQGEVFDVVVDVRLDSPTFGRSFGIYLNMENMRQLWIPPGFAHGFQVISETALFCYKCSDYYQAENEWSLLWNDPELNIDWPIKAPILSTKDSNAKRLREFDRTAFVMDLK